MRYRMTMDPGAVLDFTPCKKAIIKSTSRHPSDSFRLFWMPPNFARPKNNHKDQIVIQQWIFWRDLSILRIQEAWKISLLIFHTPS